MKRIYSSWNLAAVHHAKNVLAAANIRSVVKNEFLSSAMGDLPPAECQAELWVEEKDALEAEKALRTRVSGPDWTCTCGETLGPQFTHCWKCGAARADARA